MIRIIKRAWLHILKYHTATPSPTHANKSTFYSSENLIQLLKQATLHPPVGKMRRHLVRTFDAGHPVGTDRRTKKPTSTVTVITKLNGDLVNMFPGHP